jgi:hypothetical protein
MVHGSNGRPTLPLVTSADADRTGVPVSVGPARYQSTASLSAKSFT